MDEGQTLEQVLRQMADAAREAQTGPTSDSAAVAARQELLLAALPRIVVELRRQGVAEEDLFAAVVAALQQQLPDAGQG